MASGATALGNFLHDQFDFNPEEQWGGAHPGARACPSFLVMVMLVVNLSFIGALASIDVIVS